MGFTSWHCSACKQSIPNMYSTRAKDSDAVLVTPERVYEGLNTGYAQIGDVDIYKLIGGGSRDKGLYDVCDDDKTPSFEVKMLHKRCFHGQSYDQLPVSSDCDYQGFFYPEKEEEIMYGDT